MSGREPVVKTMKASQARAEWSAILNGVFRKENRVLVEKSGIPVAAIVSADDLEYLAQRDAERRASFEAIEAIRARNADKDPDEVESDIAEEIAAMRAERRAQAEHPSVP